MSTLNNELLSRKIALEIDSSRGQLGATPSKEIGHGAQRAAEHEFYKWGFKADVTSVQQGSLDNKHACLIAFEFRFMCDSAGKSGRFSDAKITLKLKPATKPSLYPDIKLYSPQLLKGPVHVGNHARDTTWSASVGAGDILPLSSTIGFARAVGVEYPRDYRFKIKGRKWAKKETEQYNKATWDLQEDSLQGDGIPMIFKAAVVVHQIDHPIHATIKASTTTKSGIPLFGWPWSACTPLIFNPGVVVGQQLDVSDFGQLEDRHWRQLCDIPEVITFPLPSNPKLHIQALGATSTAATGGLLTACKDRRTNKNRDLRDIRLGDVVVSQPASIHGGVKQYDFGKAIADGDFQPSGFLNSPPRALLNAVSVLRQLHEGGESDMPTILNQMLENLNNATPSYEYPGPELDRLFEVTYNHPEDEETCEDCDEAKEITRPDRPTNSSRVHCGVIASGNQIIKDPAVRDRLGSDCICFEIEAAGLMNDFPCLVIRGICDYANTHKNDSWQRYAAAVAAASVRGRS